MMTEGDSACHTTVRIRVQISRNYRKAVTGTGDGDRGGPGQARLLESGSPVLVERLYLNK